MIKQIATKQKVLQLPKEFRHFDDLINDNIDDIIIQKQINKDAT